MNFAYEEAGEEKNALVKLRVCAECAFMLNYGRKTKIELAGSRKAAKAEAKAREKLRCAARTATSRRVPRAAPPQCSAASTPL